MSNNRTGPDREFLTTGPDRTGIPKNCKTGPDRTGPAFSKNRAGPEKKSNNRTGPEYGFQKKN